MEWLACQSKLRSLAMPSHQSVGPFFDGLTRSLEDQHGTPKIISFSGISFWGTPHPSKKRERGRSFMLVGEVGPQCFHQDTHLSKPQACCREQKEQMNSLAKDTAGHRFAKPFFFGCAHFTLWCIWTGVSQNYDDPSWRLVFCWFPWKTIPSKASL